MTARHDSSHPHYTRDLLHALVAVQGLGRRQWSWAVNFQMARKPSGSMPSTKITSYKPNLSGLTLGFEHMFLLQLM